MASNPLTKEIVVDKCKKKDFAEIKNINLWGSDLDDVSLLRQLPNIEVVSLSVNRISSLADFAHCPRIQELYLRKNQISDLGELRHLQGLKHLKVLWLSDNPCASDSNYRTKIISILPQLSKIDSQEIGDDERTKASKLNIEVGSSQRNQHSFMTNGSAKSKSPFRSNENLSNVQHNVSTGSAMDHQSSVNSGYNSRVKSSQAARA